MPTSNHVARSEPFNVAQFLPRTAAEFPEQPGVIAYGKGGPKSITFRGLDQRSDAVAHGLRAEGVRRGDRVLLFVRAGVELIAITYALFKVGAVPVLIDPGMGRKKLLACVARMQPRVMIGIPAAHAARLLFPASFRSVEVHISVGRRLGFGGANLERIARPDHGSFKAASTESDDEAAILFTSGSTGPPKGVTYTHGMFRAQVEALKALYDMEPGGRDLACLPLFALFDIALATTSVFPPMDPSRPASCDPALMAQTIAQAQPSTTFGSPAIWRRILPFAEDNGLEFPSLRRILIAGAPVPPDLIERFKRVAPRAEVFTPYGATESLPVCNVSGTDLLHQFRSRIDGGEGTCVGQPAPGIELRLIEVDDAPLASWSATRPVPSGARGEICVRGDVVTREYKFDEAATQAAKIEDAGTIWHRMGDVGHLDRDGNLWFEGRKAHRIETEQGTLMPVPVENVYNRHPRVLRTALVGVGPRGAEQAALVIQVEPGGEPRSTAERDALLDELRALARGIPDAERVHSFLFKGDFPVDVRHNAKIDRAQLGEWAEGELA